MSPKDLSTFLSLFEVPNPGAQSEQAALVVIANSVRKVLKGEARKQQSWGLAVQSFVNGEVKMPGNLRGAKPRPSAAAPAVVAPVVAEEPLPPKPEPTPVPEPVPVPVPAKREPTPEPPRQPDPEPEPELPSPPVAKKVIGKVAVVKYVAKNPDPVS